MAQTTLTENVKTRVSSDAKAKILSIAKEKELGEADIVREAIREYLARNSKPRKAA